MNSRHDAGQSEGIYFRSQFGVKENLEKEIAQFFFDVLAPLP